jgi:hypothetical protein
MSSCWCVGDGCVRDLAWRTGGSSQACGRAAPVMASGRGFVRGAVRRHRGDRTWRREEAEGSIRGQPCGGPTVEHPNRERHPDSHAHRDGASGADVRPTPTGAARRHASKRSALAALAALSVKGRAPKTGYSRERFGDGWATVAGCDMRDRILIRDLTRKTYESGSSCDVQSGHLNDPYTAAAVRYVRGGASEVDVDHVVALSDAWQTGAQRWSEGKRAAFANDPLNLLSVEAEVNRGKGDGDAATWLPPTSGFVAITWRGRSRSSASIARGSPGPSTTRSRACSRPARARSSHARGCSECRSCRRTELRHPHRCAPRPDSKPRAQQRSWCGPALRELPTRCAPPGWHLCTVAAPITRPIRASIATRTGWPAKADPALPGRTRHVASGGRGHWWRRRRAFARTLFRGGLVAPRRRRGTSARGVRGRWLSVRGDGC